MAEGKRGLKARHLLEDFGRSFLFDEKSKGQLKYSFGAVAAGYAGLAGYAFMEPAAYSLLVDQFSWQQLPFHAIGILLVGSLGAGAKAFLDRNKTDTPETPQAPEGSGSDNAPAPKV